MDKATVRVRKDIIMPVDKSKQLYSSSLTDDIDLNCFCGERVHLGNWDNEGACQETCPNCGQKWVTFLHYVAVKEDKGDG